MGVITSERLIQRVVFREDPVKVFSVFFSAFRSSGLPGNIVFMFHCFGASLDRSMRTPLKKCADLLPDIMSSRTFPRYFTLHD